VWAGYWLLATSVTPVGSVTGDAISYILGFGPLGVGIVLFGLGYIVPKSVMNNSVSAARSDLVAENIRLIAEKKQAEDQRDEALKLATDQLVPMLVSFTAATQSLLPLLQELVRDRERREGSARDRDRR
jgi:hypothetical protein